MHEQNSHHFADDIFKCNLFLCVKIVYFDQDITEVYS